MQFWFEFRWGGRRGYWSRYHTYDPNNNFGRSMVPKSVVTPQLTTPLHFSYRTIRDSHG